MSGFDRQGKPNAEKPVPPKMAPTSEQMRSMGYTGNFCGVCGSGRMRFTGYCSVCEECGTTTGCS